ncbi:MAG: PqqD family protein [Chloroflexi bacterium]|nr:PqqD family protein [Chloroflexota bacterium]
MNSSACFKVNSPKVIDETIDGEVVLINLDTGNYYSLDGAGTHIWALIESNSTVEEIVAEMVSRCHSSGTDMESAVLDLLGELQREELIVPHGDNGPADIRRCDLLAGTLPVDRNLDFKAPVLRKYTDLQDLLLLDPIHEVDDAGWPSRKPVPIL